MKQHNHNKISHTAVYCASRLAKESRIKYAKEIYENLIKYDSRLVKDGNNWLYNIILRVIMLFPKVSVLRSHLEARYLLVNDALRRNKNPYVLELAARFSPRGLNFTDTRDSFFIETDLPELLGIKEEIVDKIAGKRKNYKFICANVLNRNDLEKASNLYARSDRKKALAIIHTGLFMYLNREEQAKMRDNIAYILRKFSPNGMWITTDVSFGAKIFQSHPILKWMLKQLEKKTGRPLTFFQNFKEVNYFMSEGGFSVQYYAGKKIIHELSSNKKVNSKLENTMHDSFMYSSFVMKLAKRDN